MAHSIREFSIKNFQLVRDKMRRKQKKMKCAQLTIKAILSCVIIKRSHREIMNEKRTIEIFIYGR